MTPEERRMQIVHLAANTQHFANVDDQIKWAEKMDRFVASGETPGKSHPILNADGTMNPQYADFFRRLYEAMQ